MPGRLVLKVDGADGRWLSRKQRQADESAAAEDNAGGFGDGAGAGSLGEGGGAELDQIPEIC